MRTKLLIGMIGASFAAAALAQGTAPADVIKARQAGMKAVGAGFKGLMEQTRGTPDAVTVKRHAASIAAQSPKVPAWFGPGTASAPGLKTGARAEIWTQMPAFRKAAAEFDAQAKRTLALANAGDMAALGPQVRALGGTCKTCHDSFRAKED
jgi:cytochrome c556